MTTKTPIVLTGQTTLQSAQQLQPVLSVHVYEHALILSKATKTGMQEYPISPKALSKALGEKVVMRSGLLNPNIISVKEQGDTRTVVAYRPPQVTAIWLDGVDEPYNMPMPGMLMQRTIRGGRPTNYSIWAVKRRPMDESDQLYHAPLPNIGSTGSCWGTVQRPGPDQIKDNDLSPDWAQFLGSRFGNHMTGNRSRKYDKDVRKLYGELVGQDRYPLDDLMPTMTIAEVI